MNNVARRIRKLKFWPEKIFYETRKLSKKTSMVVVRQLIQELRELRFSETRDNFLSCFSISFLNKDDGSAIKEPMLKSHKSKSGFLSI